MSNELTELCSTEEKFYELIDAIEREKNVECDGIVFEDFFNENTAPEWIKVPTDLGFNCYPVIESTFREKLWDLRNDAVRKSKKVVKENVNYRLALPSYKMLDGDHLPHRARLDQFTKIANQRFRISGGIYELVKLGFAPVLYRARISANRFMSFLPSECEPVRNIEEFFNVGKGNGKNGIKKIVFKVPNLDEQVFYFNQRGISRKKAVEQIARNFTRFEVDAAKLVNSAYQFVVN